MKIIQAKLREILNMLQSVEIAPEEITDEQDVVISNIHTGVEELIDYCDKQIIEENKS